MANKLYAMEQLTEEVAKDVAASPQEWMRFLNTASRLYKYTFPEQLLIYAQRPEATAVASMEIWNQKMYRWIKKGSKGIALIDNTSGPKTKLRYVFDVQESWKGSSVMESSGGRRTAGGRLSAGAVITGRYRRRTC